MSDRMIRVVLSAVLGLSALFGAGCTSPAGDHDEPMASVVTVKDQWAAAADAGMTAVFGSFANTGHHDAHIVSGNSPLAGRVEVHEVVTDPAGVKAMRPKGSGITVPAGGTAELIPGGDHLMLMDLHRPLQAGADVEVTVVFDDGSSLPITAQVRDFAGANEQYTPGGETPGGSHHGHG